MPMVAVPLRRSRWKLIALEVQPDHVHFFINAPTHESPADIARWVKGRASHHLRKEFPELKKLPALWTPTYFVATTGQVSTEVVKNILRINVVSSGYTGLKP